MRILDFLGISLLQHPIALLLLSDSSNPEKPLNFVLFKFLTQ